MYRPKLSFRNLFFLIVLLFLPKVDASILVSEREIEIESEKAWEQMKTSLPISRDLSKRTQVNCIAKKIIRQLDEPFVDEDWEIEVFENPGVNAFAMPGGKLGVYTGLFSVASNQDELGKHSCESNFHSYFEYLMDVAVENPASANKVQFARLIRAGIDSGAISSREGKRVFNQYFEPEFFALKGEARSNCVALQQKAAYVVEMDTELKNKKVGLLDALGDEASFRLSQRYYQDLLTVIDAVDHSCEASLARR